MDILNDLGVKKVINASGTKTYLGGTIPNLQVMEDMKEASQHFVNMMELIQKSGEFLANVTGAESAMITSCSSAAMTLSVAACMMKGTELEKIDIFPLERVDFDQEWLHIIQKLPNQQFYKNEVIIQKGHRCPFDYAFTIPGAILNIIGSENKCSLDELKNAINNKTLAIGFMARYEDRGLPLTDVIKLAKEKNIPVIVDAASEIPPKSNLTKYINLGADLVIISGGKHLGGPNDTGILCGRKDLIKLAKLQSAPYRGIGRGMKVDRTQIVGLLSAIQMYLLKDETEQYCRWKSKAEWINENIDLSNEFDTKIVCDDERRRVFVHLVLKDELKITVSELVLKLRKGDPSIWVVAKNKKTIEIDTSNLKDGEEKIIVDHLNKISLAS